MLSFEKLFSLPDGADIVAANCHSSNGDGDIVADCHGSDDARTTPCSVPCLPVEMKCQRSRLQTFRSWPLTCARTLARYGFYVSRGGDCIRCAFCGLEVVGFSSPLEVKLWHWRARGRECPLLRGEEGAAEETAAKGVMARCDGVSREGAIQRETSAPSLPRSGSGQLLQNEPASSPNSLSPFKKSYRGTLQTSLAQRSSKSQEPLRTSHCTLQTCMSRDSASHHHHHLAGTARMSSASTSPEVTSGAGEGEPGQVRRDPTAMESNQLSPTSSSVSSSTCSTWADIVQTASLPDMVAYQSRLHTFSSWPLLHPTPHHLARAGFFRETKSSSSRPTTAAVLTSRVSRSPPFALSSSPPPGRANAHQTGSRHGEGPLPAEACPQTGCPSRSSGDSVHAGTPSSCGRGGRGERLDSVRCFWCGQRVHQWRRSDDPVLEHARLSPGCRYVMQLLGRQLHHDVIMTSASSGE